MSVQLDHTIVAAADKEASAAFLAEVLGLPAPKAAGPFLAVELANGVTLDFMDVTGDVEEQHYAFAISEAEFDDIFARLLDRGLPYWADPFRTRPNEVRRWEGTRGVYFQDPSGHLLEVLTRP